MDIKDKINSLTEKSIWYFAKQETSFDKVFKACLLIDKYPDGTINEIFENYADANGVGSNYRVLSVAQLFGLLTKTNPFQKYGSSYDKGELTPVFYSLKSAGLGTATYELIKAEQVLKIRMRAVTDSTDNIVDFAIYPLLFACEVLWNLHKNGIEEVAVDKFFTYVMTAKTHAELNDTVNFLLDESSPVTSFLEQYKSDCRVDSLFQKNTDYLIWDKTSVKLNAKHEDFFRQLFDGSYRCVLNVLYSVVDNVNAYQTIQTKWLGFNKVDMQGDIKPLPCFSISSTISFKYRPYITAIKSKPFLLLAGISGTGKSRIVRELARACWDVDSEEYKAHKPKNYEMVQVKPNWHDSSELIGYVSRINGEKYVVGPFLQFMVKAIKDPEHPYFLCLDEMNLAPVEQYFAEYLSVVESRKSENGVVVTDPIVDYEPTEAYISLINQLFGDDAEKSEYLKAENGKRLSIPQNLIVVGTVNMDETTFSFSRKVLDRAMTIEMNDVDLEGGLTDKHEVIGKLGIEDLVGTKVEGVDVYSENKEVCDKVIGYLKAVNAVLEGTPFKVAYRTRNEFLLYVVNNLPYRQDEAGNELTEEEVIARALDEITSMKVLSRIEGDDSKVTADWLSSLSSTIKKGLDEISGLSYVAYINKVEVEDTENKNLLSVSLAKLEEMKRRLESGYTSFWS